MSLTCSNCNSQVTVKDFKSPIPSNLLNTNDPPLAPQMVALREGLPAMEDELTQLKNALHALQRRIKGVEYSIIVTKGALSPIRHVPREILVHIFQMAIDRRYVSLNTRTDIWSFSRVCRIWKEAALSFHQLWTNIRYDEKIHGVKNPGGLLSTIFANSAPRPVKLSLTLLSDGPGAIKLLEAAISHSSRWQEIRLHLRSQLFSHLQTAMKKSLPLLETLHMSSSSAGTLNLASSSFGRAFADAPRLYKATFSELLGVEKSLLPWKQIRVFENDRYRDGSQWLQVLYKLPNLERLPRSLRGNSLNQTTLTVLTLAKVRSLSLSQYQSMVHRVVMPGLEEVHDICEDNVSILVSLIKRSGCSIKCIGLNSIRFQRDIQALSSFLQLTPQVTDLHLQKHYDLTGDKEYILPVLQSPRYLPKLETLRLSTFNLSMQERYPETESFVQTLLNQKPTVKSIVFVDRKKYECSGLDAARRQKNYYYFSLKFGSVVEVSILAPQNPNMELGVEEEE